MATEFSTKVIALIQKIPKGKVATYGQIAALAGKPHAARGVSWILHSSSKLHALPWQRVLGSKGKISFPKASRHYVEQLRLLKTEGVSRRRKWFHRSLQTSVEQETQNRAPVDKTPPPPHLSAYCTLAKTSWQVFEPS